jgi:hypothetical protein
MSKKINTIFFYQATHPRKLSRRTKCLLLVQLHINPSKKRCTWNGIQTILQGRTEINPSKRGFLFYSIVPKNNGDVL